MNILRECIKNLPESATLEINATARSMRNQGRDIINLAAGEPDFNPPDCAHQTAIESIQKGFTKYTAVDGIPELKQAILQKTQETVPWQGDLSGIIVGCGAKQLIFNTFFATLNKGDEVIIPSPYWVSYPDIVGMLGGKAVIVPCDAKQDFKIKPEQLQNAITDRTKWLILNSPQNPTGAVYNDNELEKIGQVLKQAPHVWVMSDDIYSDISYVGLSHIIQHLKQDRLVLINGVSKSFSMTGWRIGWALGAQSLIQALKKIQSQQTSNPCSIAQKAAYGALQAEKNWILEKRKVFQQRCNIFYKELAFLGFELKKPDGAFYMYAGIKPFIGKKFNDSRIQSDKDFCLLLLQEAGVASVPGSAFGLSPYVRFSYAQEEERLLEGLLRIKNFVEKVI